MTNNYLQKLEEESIYIIREAIAEFENPVMLYSIGKEILQCFCIFCLKAFIRLRRQ